MNRNVVPLFLLLTLGVVWGSGYSLARYAMTHGVSPLGYSFWQSVGPALLLLAINLGRRAQWFGSESMLKFYIVCGVLGIVLPNTNLYFAAAHLPAGLLAVVVNTVPVMTYSFALILGRERFRYQRFVGILLTVIGIYLLVLPKVSLSGVGSISWVVIALLTPCCFALCALYVERCRPEGSDSLVLASGMLIASSLILSPIVFAHKAFFPIGLPLTRVDGVILLEIVLSTLGYVLFFQLLKRAGAVYYSLVGGVVAITGLIWGWLIFNEKLAMPTAISVILIIAGVLTVSLWGLGRTNANH